MMEQNEIDALGAMIVAKGKVMETNKAKEQQLKPCPCCESNSLWVGKIGTAYYQIICRDCEIAASGKTEEKAAAQWNRRPDVKAAPPVQQGLTAEDYLRERYGAYRGHAAWREMEEAFNAGKACHPALDQNAVRDAARLDWIEAHARRDPKMDGQHTWWPTTFNDRIKGATLREAIDAAMSAATANKGG